MQLVSWLRDKGLGVFERTLVEEQGFVELEDLLDGPADEAEELIKTGVLLTVENSLQC